MDNIYRVKKLENIGEIKVQAPGSKSITNRALLLAADLEGKYRTPTGKST